MSILPASKPKLDAADVKKIIDAKLKNSSAFVVCLGIRGYYENTMGQPGRNDRGIYDDAFFWKDRSGVVTNWNGNTDPSITRKHMAVLTPGVWDMETGLHGISRPNPYPAFRQGGRFTVARDGEGPDSGFFGINLHRGGKNTTSSEGCQTVPDWQWLSFRDTGYAALGTTAEKVRRGDKKPFKYVLVTQDEAEKILGRTL